MKSVLDRQVDEALRKLRDDIKNKRVNVQWMHHSKLPVGPQNFAGSYEELFGKTEGNPITQAMQEMGPDNEAFRQANDEYRRQRRELEASLDLKGKQLSVELLPGRATSRFLGHLLPRRYRERELEAFYADQVMDYTETLARGDLVRARWIRWMLPAQMVCVVVRSLLAALLGKAAQVGASKD